jgi:hypothetical protein
MASVVVPTSRMTLWPLATADLVFGDHRRGEGLLEGELAFRAPRRHRCRRDRPAVYPGEGTGALELIEVGAGGDTGDTEGVAQLAHPHESALVDEALDLLAALVCGQRVPVGRMFRGSHAPIFT